MKFREDGWDEHLPEGLLLRYLDEELTAGEARGVERHIAGCAECRGKLAELRRTAIAVDDLFLSAPLSYSHGERDQLAFAIVEREQNARDTRVQASAWANRLWSKAGWWGVAAALAAGIAVTAVRLNFETRQQQPVQHGAMVSSTHTFDIDGEKFWPLPYSNPDLPLNAPRVVEMQIPVSSLAEVGIITEPVTRRAMSSDDAVLADVLLGLDGQPLGVHVIAED